MPRLRVPGAVDLRSSRRDRAPTVTPRQAPPAVVAGPVDRLVSPRRSARRSVINSMPRQICRWRPAHTPGRVPTRPLALIFDWAPQRREGSMATPRFPAVAILTVIWLTVGACSGRQESPTYPPPPAAATGSVWVADEGADSISVIDVATHSVAMTLAGIAAPHNVQTVREGAVVYATSGAEVVVAIDPMTYRSPPAHQQGPHPLTSSRHPTARCTSPMPGTARYRCTRDRVWSRSARLPSVGCRTGCVRPLGFSDRRGKHDSRHP